MPDQISVLFCCMGNICRSTMAEGVFQAMAKKAPYEERVGHIDSCGTIGFHTGDDPDERTMATLRKNGITDYQHRARKVSLSDFEHFDYIFAMDRQNLNDLQILQRRKPGTKARVLLFGEYSGTGRAEVISDPYYGGDSGFTKAYDQAVRFSQNFLDELVPEAKRV